MQRRFKRFIRVSVKQNFECIILMSIPDCNSEFLMLRDVVLKCCDRFVGALSYFPLDILSQLFTIKLAAMSNFFLFVESSRRRVLVVLFTYAWPLFVYLCYHSITPVCPDGMNRNGEEKINALTQRSWN